MIIPCRASHLLLLRFYRFALLGLALCQGLPPAPAAGQVRTDPPTTTSPWAADYDQAVDQAKAEGKKLLLVFTLSGPPGQPSRHSKMFEQVVLASPEFATWARSQVVLVRVDVSAAASLSDRRKVQNAALKAKYLEGKNYGYPTVLITAAGGQEVGRNVGYFTSTSAARYVEILQLLEAGQTVPEYALNKPPSPGCHESCLDKPQEDKFLSKHKAGPVATEPLAEKRRETKPFTEVDIDGVPVHFPGDYAGKLVLLDFWAAWCHACMVDQPKLKEVYQEFHPKGFEVLGVNLTQRSTRDFSELATLKAFLQKNALPWRQLCDGGYYGTKVAQLYQIHAIPAYVLVDGITGKVVAEGEELRGKKLRLTVARALENLGRSPLAAAP